MRLDAGDQLRLRHDGRHLLLERRKEVLASVHVGVVVRVEVDGETTTVKAAELGSPMTVDGREYRIRLSRRGVGEIRAGDVLVARLEMRHADHGSVLLIDAVAPCGVRAMALMGAAAYANGVARRRKGRATLWGKENALEDVITFVYLDMRTGDHPGFEIGGGDIGGFEAGGGGGGGDGSGN